MVEYIWATLASRIRLRMALVPSMISWAAMRPWPSLVLHSVCEITACSDSESMARTISFSSAGETSMMRSMVLAALGVCRVPKTRDRKSTRLNSSHLVISYAVFCLKKKKKTTTSNEQSDEDYGEHS